MYRVLAADQPVRERRNQREHPQYTKPERVATAPNQTWSWDITKLLGPTKWAYFYLYVVLDIFSRYAVGWMVADRENSALAGRLIEQTCHKQGVQPQVLTLHSDRARADDEQVHRTTARRPRRDPFTEPPSDVRRQPLLRGAVQDPEVPPRLPWPLPRHHRRDRLLPNVLPLVQHRTSPWRDRDAHPGRCTSQSNPEHAGAARADPSSRLDPSSRTLRSRAPTTRSPSPSRLDQPTCDTHNRRNCSVNRNRHCLKVVDRFRRSYRGFNLFLDDDYDPCLTMARGQWRISGFRAVDLRACLAWLTPTRCSSLLKRLRTHGMIKKVGRRYKDYLTKLRRRVVTTALHIREFVVLPSLCVTCV